MELFSNLAIGFHTAVSPDNLLYCFLGTLIGTLIGVLPGIGPVQTLAILLPATFALPPVSALIMLAGIYYGAQYGGSTTSILVNVPGEASSAIARGTLMGSLLGILPGGGAILASFISYMLEKKISRDPSSFGKGNIRGVASPESANNAAAQTSFIPLLTLGIPPNVVLAMMAGAMMIHGIQPGPRVISSNPALFWGVIVSMWVGNLMLLVLNLPLIGIWVRLLSVPYRILYPAILLFCCIGIYSVNNNTFDILLTALLGFLGYLFYKLECEPAPLILGFVLGPMMEENLRRGMLLSRGDPSVFFTRPLSLAFLVMSAAMLVIVAVPVIRGKRESAFQGEEEK